VQRVVPNRISDAIDYHCRIPRCSGTAIRLPQENSRTVFVADRR